MPATSKVLAASLVMGVASCAGPDRGDYRAAAEQHARSAEIARQGAAANEAAARSLAAQGDYATAARRQEDASEFRKAYRLEHFQSEKDEWLSQWWPSLPGRDHD
jgi:hypothetical protein